MATNYDHRDFRNPAFDPLALAIGRMTLAWNDIMVSLGGLFWALSRIPNELISGAIWHAIKNDRTQRDIVKDLASLTAIGNEIPQLIREEIEWTLKNVNRLEEDRNNFLHSPFVNSKSGISTLHIGQHKRALKLDNNENYIYAAENFYKKTIILRDYIEELADCLRDEQKQLPKRPKLPNREAFKKSNTPKQ